ncbi:hypothetical protein C0J52_16843 [Blattella germanica]|nr:hypothetical protein C0J52_16843 [Blattella germanica]
MAPNRIQKCRQTLKVDPIKQSMGKAVSMLPNSPKKIVAAVIKLFKDIIPSRPIVLDKNKLKRADALSEETANQVREFYCMDFISRLTPGHKDAKSIKDPRTGKRQLIQKRYLLMTILEAFDLFKADHYQIQILLITSSTCTLVL